MKRYVLIYLSVIIFILCSCTNVKTDDIDANKPRETSIRTSIQSNKDAKESVPKYVDKRLSIISVEKNIVSSDGLKEICKANIRYSENKVLELVFYCKYLNDGIYADIIYVKSNMNDEIIEIYNSTSEKGYHDNVKPNIELSMYTYRVLDITLDGFWVFFNIEQFIDASKYPNEFQTIIENHPKVPDLSTANKVYIQKDKQTFVELENVDAEELIEVYRNITNDLFYDNEEDGRPTYMLANAIFITDDRNTYKFQPICGTPGVTLVDGAQYNFFNKRVFEIMKKYGVPLENIDFEKIPMKNEG